MCQLDNKAKQDTPSLSVWPTSLLKHFSFTAWPQSSSYDRNRKHQMTFTEDLPHTSEALISQACQPCPAPSSCREYSSYCPHQCLSPDLRPLSKDLLPPVGSCTPTATPHFPLCAPPDSDQLLVDPALYGWLLSFGLPKVRRGFTHSCPKELQSFLHSRCLGGGSVQKQ